MDGFIVVGNTNAVTYKEVFPLIKANKVRLGYNTVKTFNTKEGDKKFSNTSWFVTYPVQKKPLTLTKTYNPTDYPKYDNYDAIEVGRIKDIPCDYKGLMGVPITIFEYDSDCFDVIQLCASHSKEVKNIPNENCRLNEKWKYPRILIRRKEQ